MRPLVPAAVILFSSLAYGAPPVVATAPVPPKAVTRAWLRETLEKKGALERLLDEASGLVTISYETDTPSLADAARLCKENLKKGWPGLERGIRTQFTQSDGLFCQNAPGPPLCVFELLHMSDATTTYLLFRPAADGTLRLDAVLFLNGRVTDKEMIVEQDRYLEQQLTRLRSTDCSAKSVTPSDLYRSFHAEQVRNRLEMDKPR